MIVYYTSLVAIIPLYIMLLIQLDRIYPRYLLNFVIYYAWALSFCNFLFIFSCLMIDLPKYENFQLAEITYFIMKTDFNDIFNSDLMLWFINNNPSYLVSYQESRLPKLAIADWGTWIQCSWFTVNWFFVWTTYEFIMLCIVTFISSMVQLYSINYMVFDDYKKFTTYISFFTFFMIILVSANNFLVLFFGWEGVGLCSYLLINFWYTRINANLAAMKALIVNRVADMALTIGIILIYLTFWTLDFDVVFPLVPFFIDEKITILQYEFNTLKLVGLLIFIGAMGKSAQIGLHTWLPDAMEGPTPVSALIHAATMVTAGVYLVIKCSPLYEYIPNILNIILFVGAFTAFFSALIGLLQNDIKKIIAYSTCSQLGYMVFCCGLSAYDISFFHLINHAFFKALLFLGAGSLIHSLANEQDLRRYGISISNARFTYIMFLIGSFALVGFPFLTGFYSKDLILEIAYTKYTVSSTFAYFIGIFTAFLTAIYSFRIIYLSFIFEKNIYRRFLTFDTSIFFTIPLLFLAFGSVVFGYIAKDLFVGIGSDAFEHTILILPENNYILSAEFFGWTKNCSVWWVKLIPFIIVNLAILITILINQNYIILFQKTSYFKKLLAKKFFFDIFYNKVIINGFWLMLSYDYIYKYIDKILLEIFGPVGISYIIYKSSYKVRKMHLGIIFIYGTYFLILLIVTMFIPVLYNYIFGIF